MEKYWSRCEESIPRPYYLSADNTYSYYLMEYVSGGSYKQFPDVSCVRNFKIPIEEKGKPRWRYKQEAIRYFADSIINGINPPLNDTILVPMPTSKPRNHAEFDTRLDDVVNIVHEATGQNIGFNLDAVQDSEAYHNSGESRYPAAIIENIRFTPFQFPIPTRIVLIDDVITTGAHFLACIQKINQLYPNVAITGLFLAKTIWQSVCDN